MVQKSDLSMCHKAYETPGQINSTRRRSPSPPAYDAANEERPPSCRPPTRRRWRRRRRRAAGIRFRLVPLIRSIAGGLSPPASRRARARPARSGTDAPHGRVSAVNGRSADRRRSGRLSGGAPPLGGSAGIRRGHPLLVELAPGRS